MKTIKKAQMGSAVKSKKQTSKKGIIPPGAEKSRLPFTPEERKKMPKVSNMGTAKSGKNIKKAKSGAKMTKCKYECK